MRKNLFYYSTNTYLSYFISKTFYNETFYVWCSPVFDPEKLSNLDPRQRIPRSSAPLKIYQELKRDIDSSDLHSTKICANKTGLKRGGLEALKNGIIDDNELVRINHMVDTAQLTDFNPMVYLIPVTLVENRIIRVSVDQQANPLSEEYLLKDLKGHEFEVIQF